MKITFDAAVIEPESTDVDWSKLTKKVYSVGNDAELFAFIEDPVCCNCGAGADAGLALLPSGSWSCTPCLVWPRGPVG